MRVWIIHLITAASRYFEVQIRVRESPKQIKTNLVRPGVAYTLSLFALKQEPCSFIYVLFRK